VSISQYAHKLARTPHMNNNKKHTHPLIIYDLFLSVNRMEKIYLIKCWVWEII
jgi:hypothetical protein